MYYIFGFLNKCRFLYINVKKLPLHLKLQYNIYKICSYFKNNCYPNMVGEGLPMKYLTLKIKGPYLRSETTAPPCELLQGRCEDFLSFPSDQHSNCSIRWTLNLSV